MKRALSIITALLLTACYAAPSPAETTAAATATEAASESVTEAATTTDAPETTSILSTIDYDSTVIRVDGTKFTVNGEEIWINGVNTPWDKWNDFGGAFNATFWDEHFAMLHEEGVNASRVWVNCNGMSIVKLTEDGIVTNVSKKHWSDLDKLFEIAAKHEIYLMPTLLSFDHFKDGNQGAKQWRAMVQSEEGIKSYCESYVIPFVERYGDNPYLWCIDLMNEPDWVKENKECGQVGWEYLCNFFAHEAAAIHEHSDELVTVGAGMIKYNSDKFDGNYFSDEFLSSLAGENAYLDVWSPHYYLWQKSFLGCPFETDPVSYGLDGLKPAVIGECAVVDDSGVPIKDSYIGAYEHGWNGVMAWTSNGVDDCGSMAELEEAVNAMDERIHNKSN